MPISKFSDINLPTKVYFLVVYTQQFSLIFKVGILKSGKIQLQNVLYLQLDSKVAEYCICPNFTELLKASANQVSRGLAVMKMQHM